MKALGVAAWAAVGAGVIAVGKKIIDVVKQSAQAYAEYQQLVGGVETLFGTRGAKDLQEYAKMVGKTTKEASGEFKMLQQSQSLVMDNASKAYKTAGMSMNQYMGTVTSFAASLKQSAKNEYEAAKIADMAVIDMADNANKMGTSMEAIQFAYQGFAKQNYTMLDNLKLGYGGTKTEMERLLRDAEKLTGVKYDISSLSDVYQAIHVIQEELGITGTTAKEAMETVEGSALMMKAAWENLLIGMGDKNADVGKLTDDLADSIMTWLGNIAPVVGTVVLSLLKVVGRLILKGLQAGIAKLNELLKGALKKLGNLILDLLKGALNGILSFFKKIWEEIKQAVLTIAAAIASGLKKIWEGIKAAATTVWNGIKSFLTGVWEGLRATATAIWTGVSSFFSAIWTGISTAASTIWGGIKSFLTGVWEGLSSTASSIWGGIKSFLTGVWEGLSGTASTIWGGIKDTVTNAWTAVSEKASPVWDGITNTVTNAWNAAKANAENIWGKIGETVRSAWEAISSTIASKAETIGAKVRDLWDGARSKFSDFGNWVRDTFSGIFEKAIKKIVVTIGLLVTKIHLKFMELKGKLFTVGQNIVDGLKNGINSRSKAAEDSIRSVAARMAAAARVKLAIHSPSKVFYEIGAQIAEGLKQGIIVKGGAAIGAAVNMIEDVIDLSHDKLSNLGKSAIYSKDAGGKQPAKNAEFIKEEQAAKSSEIANIGKKYEHLLNEYRRNGVTYTLGTDYTALMRDAKTADEFLTLAAKRNAKILGESIDTTSRGFKTNYSILQEWLRSGTQSVEEVAEAFARHLGDAGDNIEDETARMVSSVAIGGKDIAMLADDLAKGMIATADTTIDSINAQIKDGLEALEKAFGEAAAGYASFVNGIGIEAGEATVEYDPDVDYSALMAKAKDTEEFLDLAAKRNAKIMGENINLTAKGYADNASLMGSWLKSTKQSINQIADTLATAMEQTKYKTTEASEELFGGVSSQLKEFVDEAEPAGEDFVNGIIKGIQNRTSALVAAVKSMAKEVVEATKKALDINSPSKKGEWIGEMYGQGIANGFDGASRSAISSAIKAASGMFTTALRQIQPALAGFPQNSTYNSSNSFSISKLADNITVRSNEDIDKISDALYQRILFEKRARGLQG